MPSGTERASQFLRNRRTFSMDVSRVESGGTRCKGVLQGEQAGNRGVPRSRTKGRPSPMGATTLKQENRITEAGKRRNCTYSARLGPQPLRAGGWRDYSWSGPCTFGTLSAATSARKRQAFCTRSAKDAEGYDDALDRRSARGLRGRLPGIMASLRGGPARTRRLRLGQRVLARGRSHVRQRRIFCAALTAIMAEATHARSGNQTIHRTRAPAPAIA